MTSLNANLQRRADWLREALAAYAERQQSERAAIAARVFGHGFGRKAALLDELAGSVRRPWGLPLLDAERFDSSGDPLP